MRRVLLRLMAFVRAGSADAELSRELAAHLRILEDEYLARGMSVGEARFAARRAFGGQVEQTRLRHRDARSFRLLDEWWLDARLGARMLAKYPGLTLVGGLGMAVAIAISTASFAFFHAYLTSTLPLPEGERVVALENWDIERHNEFRHAIHDLELWRREMTTFEDVGAFRTIGRNLIVPGGAAEPTRIAEMTASAFHIARVQPLLGRFLVEADERVDAPAVVVIGYDAWQSRFAADPQVIGREVRLGHTVHTVVGVMPEGFLFPVHHSFWVPLTTRAADFARGEGPEIFIFGRLADDATLEEADAQLAAVGQRTAAAFPDSHGQLRPRVLPYAYPILDIQDVTLLQVGFMQFTMSILLVVVAVNIAVLVYARTATRQGEIAVRTALGASRARIVAQLFTEALVLAAVAAAAGLALAQVGLQQAHAIMLAEGARPPYWIDYGIPGAAVVYIAGATLAAAAIAGVLPALQATGRRVQATLRQLGGGTGQHLGKIWTALIVGQVAFAVAALPIAIGVAWGEIHTTAIAPRFDADEVLAVQMAVDAEPPPGVDPAAHRADMRGRLATVQNELVGRLEAEPWVADVTSAHAPPGQENTAAIELQGVSPESARPTRQVQVNHVATDFFDAFDVPLLSGRAFTSADAATGRTREAGGRVIVNRAFAERVLGGSNPLGRRIRYAPDRDDAGAESEPWLEIIGMVGDLHGNAADPSSAPPAVYHALAPQPAGPVSVVARVSGGSPDRFVARVREIMTELDPTVRVVAYPLVEIYRQANLAMQLVAAGLLLVIVTVLLLSAAGIYALMSFTVSQRRKEIGIRAALGADASRLLRSVFARSASQLAFGIIAGVAVATLVDMAGGNTLLGSLRSPLLATMAGLMLAVGLLASAGPARRGLRTQPIQALREE